MKNIRFGLIGLWVLASSVISAEAQVSIGIGLPNVSIGINLPMYPELVPVPGYPVYYAPQVDGNYFFYDSMYWVYQNDNWYASSWYNGPWGIVAPTSVPLYILRVPVSYYRQPPVYFRGWQSNAPPRWGQHWGNRWQQQHRGWDKWKRSAVPARAPLPAYQRQYSGDRYPRVEHQQALRNQSYRYQPQNKAVRQHIQQQVKQNAPAAQRGRPQESPVKNPRQQEQRGSMPHQQAAPVPSHSQQPQRGGGNAQRPAPAQAPPQQRGPANREQRPQPAVQQHQQQAPRQQPQAQGQRPQERGAAQEPNRGHGQEQRKGDERGGRN